MIAPPPAFAFVHKKAAALDSYTKVLLHMNGTDQSTTFTDQVGKTWTAYGNAQIDTGKSKFGGASGMFDGTGDYISTPNSADFDFGTGDFTIDFWMYRNGTFALLFIFDLAQHAGGNGLAIGMGTNGNKIRAVWNDTEKILTAGIVADLTWTHIAIVRYGNTVKVYLNGIADANTDDVPATPSARKVLAR
jgi:hypothetical protein